MIKFLLNAYMIGIDYTSVFYEKGGEGRIP